MQINDQTLAIEQATAALRATASQHDDRKPRAMIAVIGMMVCAIVLLALVPLLLSSARPDTGATGAETSTPAAQQQSSVDSTEAPPAPTTAVPGTPAPSAPTGTPAVEGTTASTATP